MSNKPDQNAVERQRWGGPSPTAGQDTRTPAQLKVIADVDAQARGIIERSIYAGANTNALSWPTTPCACCAKPGCWTGGGRDVPDHR